MNIHDVQLHPKKPTRDAKDIITVFKTETLKLIALKYHTN